MKNNNTAKMELKKLVTFSLPEALRAMQVGETCIAPADYSERTVRAVCSKLKATEGLIFATTKKGGRQTVTRLK